MKTLEEFKKAGDIAVEQDPDLRMFLYTYKDTSINRFGPLFAQNEEPDKFVDGIKTAILKGQNVKQFVGLQLNFVGTYDLKTGIIEKFEVPQLLIDLNSIIEKVGDMNGHQA